MRSSDVSAGDTARINQYNHLRDDAYASSWLLPHEQSTPDLTLYVEEGNFYIGNLFYEFAGGNSPSFTAPTVNPRIDVLSIDDTGTLVRTVGAEAGSPVAPDVPIDEIPICQVYNRVGQTEILDTDDASNGYVYKDIRKFVYLSKQPTLNTYTFEDNFTYSQTTQFDITNPSGTTFRYTWDGTGTDPTINGTTVPVGSQIAIYSRDFSSANNGQFEVTGSGANYFEVTNASGVVESNLDLQEQGFIRIMLNSNSSTWTKPDGLKYVVVELVGSGGGGGGNGDQTSSPTVGLDGESTSFGAHLSATGGSGGSNSGSGGISSGLPGVGADGDINSWGEPSQIQSDQASDRSTPGGSSKFSGGGALDANGGTGYDGIYGAGGGAGNFFSSGSSNNRGAQGGHAGGYSKKTISADDLGATETFSVGVGGAGGNSDTTARGYYGGKGGDGLIVITEIY